MVVARASSLTHQSGRAQNLALSPPGRSLSLPEAPRGSSPGLACLGLGSPEGAGSGTERKCLFKCLLEGMMYNMQIVE